MTTKILLGPPGTGKTTRLMSILEEELKLVPSTRIAFTTFTREGANQGISRAMEKTGLHKDAFPFFRTLHSLAFKQAEMTKDRLMDRSNYRDLSKAMGMQFMGHYSEDLKHDDDRYLFLFDLFRNNPKMFASLGFDYENRKYEYVKLNYVRYKQLFKMYDYTDLIQEYVRIGEPLNVDVAIIDEAQDLTSLQWDMIKTAFKNCQRVYIAGDDDQSIFQWAGADVGSFIDQKGERIILDQSYRLPDEILTFAKRITKQIHTRIPKDYHGTGPGGSVKMIGNIFRVGKVTPSDSWLFLSRNTSYLSNIEEFLQQQGIFYYLKGEASIKRGDIDRLELFFKLELGEALLETDRLKLEEVLKKMYDIKKGWKACFDWSPSKLRYISKWLDNGKIVCSCDNTGIRVNTIHTSKGAEAENVVVLLDISNNVDKNLTLDPDSEHRAFYVAFTRAKKNLFVVRSNSKHEYLI